MPLSQNELNHIEALRNRFITLKVAQGLSPVTARQMALRKSVHQLMIEVAVSR